MQETQMPPWNIPPYVETEEGYPSLMTVTPGGCRPRPENGGGGEKGLGKEGPYNLLTEYGRSRRSPKS